MFAVPSSLLQIARTHDPERLVFSDILNGESSTVGDVVTLAARCRYAMGRLGLTSGGTVVTDLEIGRDLAALILACWELGLHLHVEPAGSAERSHNPAAAPGDFYVARKTKAISSHTARRLSMAELGQPIPTQSSPDLVPGLNPGLYDDPARATITAGPSTARETMGSAALLQSAANFDAAFAPVAGELLLSTAAPVTLERLCTAIVIPLALGLHAVLTSRVAYKNGAPSSSPDERIALNELSMSTWLDMLQSTALDSLPAELRADRADGARILCADHAGERAQSGSRRGYGTELTGFWAIVTPAGPQARPPNYVASIRKLRSPLRLLGADPACVAGEIVLQPATGAPPIRTGDVGWMTPTGGLDVAGKLSDVSVHGGQAILLSDIELLVADIPGIRASRVFREHGLSPTEIVNCVCVTEASEAFVREALASQVGPDCVPSRIIIVPPSACSTLPPVETLRAVATGQAGKAIVAALTARRFRRNPAYDEAGLVAATDAALLSGKELHFLMFWGCGPRRHAGGPDHAAIHALGELLAAAEAAAPLRAGACIVFTDLHATNNGHSEAHYSSYFADIRASAGALNVRFELESAVWRRGGLGRDHVSALEQGPSFEQRWQRFPLRDRFIEQASRHSGLADKTAAARHYYATCLLEREVLKSLFAGSVFLTYNGPEFNECFPDLPTLYVYPGPRGRNDKPWFVTGEERRAAPETQVAAE